MPKACETGEERERVGDSGYRARINRDAWLFSWGSEKDDMSSAKPKLPD